MFSSTNKTTIKSRKIRNYCSKIWTYSQKIYESRTTTPSRRLPPRMRLIIWWNYSTCKRYTFWRRPHSSWHQCANRSCWLLAKWGHSVSVYSGSSFLIILHSHGGQCNEENYFWNLGCDHGFSYIVMAATMRDQCQVSHRCDSYTSYQRGYCDSNPSANTGWRFDKYDLVEKRGKINSIYFFSKLPLTNCLWLQMFQISGRKFQNWAALCFGKVLKMKVTKGELVISNLVKMADPYLLRGAQGAPPLARVKQWF